VREQQRKAMRQHLTWQKAAAQAQNLEAWAERERASLETLDYRGKRERMAALGVTVHLLRPEDCRGRGTLTICPSVSLAAMRAGAAEQDGWRTVKPTGAGK
jgi:hypothetical protein